MTRNTRSYTGIELLRIILFFQVVTIHVGARYFSTHFNPAALNWLISDIFVGFSRGAVDCFIIITGYFSLETGVARSFVKLRKLVAGLGGYLIVYFIWFLYKNHEKGLILDIVYSAKFLIVDFFRTGDYFYHMWYFQVLIVLLLLSGFMNAAFKAVSRRELGILTLILVALVSLVPTVHHVLGVNFIQFNRYTSELALFITLYTIGAYIRAADFGRNLSKIKCACVAFAALLCIVCFTFLYNSRFSPYTKLGFLRGFDVFYPFSSFIGIFYANENIFAIIAAAFLFLCFLKVDVRRKKAAEIICFISAGTFGAYVIHALLIYVLSEIHALDVFAHFDGKYYVLYLIAFVTVAGTVSIAGAVLMKTAFIRLLSKWR